MKNEQEARERREWYLNQRKEYTIGSTTYDEFTRLIKEYDWLLEEER